MVELRKPLDTSTKGGICPKCKERFIYYKTLNVLWTKKNQVIRRFYFHGYGNKAKVCLVKLVPEKGKDLEKMK